MDGMMEKIATIESRFVELGKLLEESGNDYQRAVELAKERAEIEEIVSAAREFRQVTSKIEEAEVPYRC